MHVLCGTEPVSKSRPFLSSSHQALHCFPSAEALFAERPGAWQLAWACAGQTLQVPNWAWPQWASLLGEQGARGTTPSCDCSQGRGWGQWPCPPRSGLNPLQGATLKDAQGLRSPPWVSGGLPKPRERETARMRQTLYPLAVCPPGEVTQGAL